VVYLPLLKNNSQLGLKPPTSNHQYLDDYWKVGMNLVNKVSWDDEIPNIIESHKIHVPNHQPD
jgi:hypothetical protein